jgi:hypothetical protein
MDDDPHLVQELASAVRRYFPQVALVEGLADLHIIFVLVDYEPGCAPNCDRFRTYRNWSCTAITRSAQAFGLNGSTYNPLVSPTDDCMKRLARYFAGDSES